MRKEESFDTTFRMGYPSTLVLRGLQCVKDSLANIFSGYSIKSQSMLKKAMANPQLFTTPWQDSLRTITQRYQL